MQIQSLKLDLGCGTSKRDGFTGVDSISFPGVDVVLNLCKPTYEPIPPGFEWMEKVFERKIIGYERWPWPDNSVAEVHSSHFLEHLDSFERCHFVNELYRVMMPGAKCMLIVPHWGSCRAYGDPSHKWSPIGEFWFYYLNREWRLGNLEKNVQRNAPHTDASNMPWGYNCNFECAWGYNPHPYFTTRSSESQQFAFQFYKEAISDIMATLTKA